MGAQETNLACQNRQLKRLSPVIDINLRGNEQVKLRSRSAKERKTGAQFSLIFLGVQKCQTVLQMSAGSLFRCQRSY